VADYSDGLPPRPRSQPNQRDHHDRRSARPARRRTRHFVQHLPVAVDRGGAQIRAA